MDAKKLGEALKKMKELGIDPKQIMAATEGGGIKDIEEAKNHTYEFWKTQPVPGFDEVVTENTYIHSNEYYSKNTRVEPFSLPKGFEWSDIDIHNDEELNEVYTLLNENYVEDDDCMFRFDYGPNFLKWALTPPKWLKSWHCGVRATSITMRTYDKTNPMAEVNFLCVHKKLRSKRVAPVLIREITRRVHLEKIYQACFTAGIIIPKPIAACRYWHRSLNPKKLIDVGFSHLPRNSTIQRQMKLYKLPEKPKTQNIKPLEERHVPSAYKLLSKYLENFDLAPVMTEDEFKHFFTPVKDVIYCYVVEDKDGNVTDMCSFYNLPSTVVSHPKHKEIKAAYSFYNVATTVSYTQLLNDALIFASENKFDVFNALNVMDNSEDVLKELKFGIGDGNLHYYLYNWKCPEMPSSKVGLVLQ
ncbi:Glycylpeptide N-tetradecanoyltransferase 2 [Strongyloides ratti]|uniref:Glycylpeptide N-tetradecanoyltransferase n=1 Tax=Strongyloides ratti TaxID=34506 RepID=A0A090MYL9_STRRB|nr:Glycylpeptide N-tetradecanoyltransferase 2 [Strongyloides ratti]CEF67414.1 Glycylpeptide N-tetradecanoyltransferase 2 [Strongyloides ratti]